MFDLFGAKRKREEMIDDVLGRAMWDVIQWIDEFGTRNELGEPSDSTVATTSVIAIVAAAYALPLAIAQAQGRLNKQAALPFIDAISRLFKGAAVGIELVRQGAPDVQPDLSTAAAKGRLQVTYVTQTKKMEAYTKGYMDFMQKGPSCGAGVLLCQTVTLDIFGKETFDVILSAQILGLPNRIKQGLP